MIGADAIRGHIDLIVLAILEHEASYPYAISQAIETTSSGEYAIKQTTLYTAMKRLEDSGAVESFPGVSEAGRPRTYYRLTELGTDLLRAKRTEWGQVVRLMDHYTKGTRER